MYKHKIACVQMEMKNNYFHNRIAQALMSWQCDRKLPFFSCCCFYFLASAYLLFSLKKNF